jgi:uncharacterized protein YacL
MTKSLWTIRVLFLGLCTLGGFAVSEKFSDYLHGGAWGLLIGFGIGGFMIAIDEMLKGFSLRAFSAVTFGLLLGSCVAWLIDTSQLFEMTNENVRWVIRLWLFIGFGYIGMVLAMRSNKEDFSLIIPYVRFASQNKPENPVVLDTSAIIDGRIAELIDADFVEGMIVVPRFVLKELQFVSDSPDATKRERGRRGLEILNRLQRNTQFEVKIHEADFPEEQEVDAKLVRLTKALHGKLFTTDFNLAKIAEIQSVPCVNIAELALKLKPVVMAGDLMHLKIVREGKDRGQGVGYTNDGTMVVVNHAQSLIGQQVRVQVTSVLQTGAGIIIFAELRQEVEVAA